MSLKPRYTINGEEYFSVTQILKTGLPTPPALLRWLDENPKAAIHSKDRATLGSIIHWKIQRFLADKFGLPRDILKLDDTSIILHNNCNKNCDLCKRQAVMVQNIDIIWSYFMDFFEEHTVEPLLLEVQVFEPELHYAGTADFYGLIDGVPTLGDWKTFKALYDDHSYGAQLAAYAHCLEKEGYDIEQVALIQLNEKAGYNFIPVIRDWNLFQTALTEFHRKIKERG